MGRRSGRYNQARKAERKSMELLAPEVNLFCEGIKRTYHYQEITLFKSAKRLI